MSSRCTDAASPAIFSIGLRTDSGARSGYVATMSALRGFMPSAWPTFALTTASTVGICGA